MNVFILIVVILLFGTLIVAIYTSNPNMGRSSRQQITEAIDDSLNYLVKKRPIERKRYVPNESVYNRFCEQYTEIPALSAMAKDILKHLGLPNNSIPVYIVDDLDDNAAGSYSYGSYGTCIELRLREDSYPPEVLAILIHECMHYYLRLTRMGFEDTQKNEILTDTATIYFGFYDFMYEGYFRAGYINKSEMKYIEKALVDMGVDYVDWGTRSNR